MNELITAISKGAIAFTATNLDDIMILLLFFSQVGKRFQRQHIVVGQYLGFLVLVFASLPGFFGGLLIPKPWIGLLGILPIVIGIQQLLTSEDDDPTIQTVSSQPGSSDRQPSKAKFGIPALVRILHPQSYQVAAVTIANGGDNIGIYVPLFASSSLLDLVIILAVFFGLVGVWCYAADRLTRQPRIARMLTRYGEKVVPYVLIGLGLLILLEAESYRLVTLGLTFRTDATLGVFALKVGLMTHGVA
jgi:cadmium resistance transport/sequestration family protein